MRGAIVKTKSLLAALTLTLSLTAGCDDQGKEPLAFQPQFARPAAESSTLQLVDVSGAESNAEFVLIDKAGGLIRDPKNGHELIVPRGAVAEPTYFSMGTLGVSKVVVKLVAYRASDNVLVTRFPKTLTLRLNFTKANVSNPRNLKVVYVSSLDLTILEVFPTAISRSGMQVEAGISHFSSYSMALD